jgi:hypothetical protein
LGKILQDFFLCILSKNLNGMLEKRRMSKVLGILFLLFLLGCAQQINDADKAAAQAELSRLAQLASAHELQPQDLSTVEALLDGYGDHELEEIGLMAGYGEYEHAAHAIGFLSDYLATGDEVLCPGHELAHYYVFMRHGDEHAAEHALEEVELEEWIPQAKAYEQQYPSGTDVDALAAGLQAFLDRIEEGDTAANDEEVAFLAGKGSFCVPEQP